MKFFFLPKEGVPAVRWHAPGRDLPASPSADVGTFGSSWMYETVDGEALLLNSLGLQG